LSTILDALRKVQRQRDRDSSDLRHAIVDDRPESAPPRGLGLWIAGACLVVLVAVASTFLFLGGDLPGEAIPEAASEPLEPPMPVAASPGASEEAERTRKKRIREAVRARLSGLNAGRSQPTAPPAESGAKPGRTGRLSTALARRAAEPRPDPGAAIDPLEATAAAAESPPAADPASVIPVAPESAVSPPEPEPVRVAAVEPDPAPPAPRFTAKPALPSPAPRRDPPARVTPTARREPERPQARVVGPRIDSPSAPGHPEWPTGFPKLELESVRWHPDASRREARLLLDATRSIDAREGDIVQGVAVHRIDPGAVELRAGDVTRLLRIGQ